MLAIPISSISWTLRLTAPNTKTCCNSGLNLKPEKSTTQEKNSLNALIYKIYQNAKVTRHLSVHKKKQAELQSIIVKPPNEHSLTPSFVPIQANELLDH